MSAKEMVEELGYEYYEDWLRITIEFYNTNTDDYDYIEFDKQCKTLSINIDQYNLKKQEIDFINLSKVINKQLEELGWNKEVINNE